MIKTLLRHPRTLALGTRALGGYLRFALRTTRWSMHGVELGQFLHGSPAVFAFWHECLPLMPALWTHALRERAAAQGRRGRMHVLVSRHQDGRLIGDMMRGFGLDLVHGSSSKGTEQKGGASGLRALLAALAAGDQVVITPDGPRGPRRQVARGVAQLAALAGVPVLPLPFGRGVLVCGAPIHVPRDRWADSLPDIAAALTGAADEAEALCTA